MDWDRAYDNRAAIADAADYPSRWGAEAESFRKSLGARARLGIAYGDHQREQLDLFLPEGSAKGLVTFIHGGYWLRFGKDFFSQLARGARQHGWAVAIVQYTLCPKIRVSGITRQIGAAIASAARQIEGPIRLAGHSAGGHLATRMICRDTPLPVGIQARIQHVLSISGVHDLRPLLNTAMNGELRLDAAEAASESPALAHPLSDIPVTCWVGADELPEFRRQNALLANIWSGLGAETACIEAPERHHLDVIDELACPDSAMIEKFLE